jgi:mannose-6-phosphate isomerase
MFDRVFVMKNTIQPYPWGSPTAIPELLGRIPSGTPQAELWMGAHPKAPSRIEVAGVEMPLDAAIAKFPEGILGRRVVEAFGGQLPYLFKVLAAASPLSIQAHPDLSQAEAGFRAENQAGIPIDAPKRSYRDANHKPECICALTPFWGLCGFRAVPEILSFMNRLCPRSLEAELQMLGLGPAADAVRRFYRRIMTCPDQQRRAVLEEGLSNAASRRDDDPAFQWILTLHQVYRDDISVLSPAFLNLFRLAPEQALFLPAGELHAYLDGVGIELMANSDNVLRGGLTSKHIDVEALLEILRTEPRTLDILTPDWRSVQEGTYASEAMEFRMSVVSPADMPAGASMENNGVEILLCTESRDLEILVDETGERTCLSQGMSVLVPAGVQRYTLRGRGKIFRASVPE